MDFVKLLVILSNAKRTIAAYTLVAMTLGAICALVLKPTFTATALILPPQQSQSAASMLGQLGSLASFASGGSIKNPADLYVGILGSRTIADEIIGEFNLAAIYKTKNNEDTRKALKSNTRFLAPSDGMIHTLVDDRMARRASDIANAYVDDLYEMNSHLAITEAAQRRVFFDREMADERLALSSAECLSTLWLAVPPRKYCDASARTTDNGKSPSNFGASPSNELSYRWMFAASLPTHYDHRADPVKARAGYKAEVIEYPIHSQSSPKHAPCLHSQIFRISFCSLVSS